MNQLVTGLSHVGIYVTDREAAIRFYQDVLGFDLLYRVDSESDGLKIAMLRLGDCVVEVLEPPVESDVLTAQAARANVIPSAMATVNHLGLTVPDIEKAAAHIRACGYEFEDRGVFDVPHFGSDHRDLKVAFFRGPNGERIELFQEIMR